MSTKPADRPQRYRFGPLEPGPILGLHVGQVLGLLGAAVFLVAGVNRGTALSVVAGLVGAAALCFGSLVPVDGDTPFGWCRRAGRFAFARLTGRTVYRHQGPRGVEVSLPSALAGCRLISVPTEGGPVGAVREGGSLTGVLGVEPTAFLLLDRAEQERRLGGWGRILASLASRGSSVARVQWVERTGQHPVDAMGSWFVDHVTLESTHPAVRSYVALLEDAGPASVDHQTLIAVSVERRRAHAAIRRSGGGELGLEVVLLREMRGLAEELANNDIKVVGALSPRQLANEIRFGFDPEAHATSEHRRATGATGGVRPEDPGPMAATESWGSYQTDRVHHVTFWVSEWPRMDVECDVLAPLLLSDGTRSIGVAMEPLDPSRAIRGIERRAASFDDDDQLRARGGWRQTGRRRRARQALDQQETELVAGHAPYRFSGYITITHPDPVALEDRCRQLMSIAAGSHLELRRLWGEQAVAHTYTLPLGRGLRPRGLA